MIRDSLLTPPCTCPIGCLSATRRVCPSCTQVVEIASAPGLSIPSVQEGSGVVVVHEIFGLSSWSAAC